jgi:hypothetical protein
MRKQAPTNKRLPHSVKSFLFFKNMLESPVVLITGVSREMGMGYETARQLARQGFQVIITARELSQSQTWPASCSRRDWP